MLIENRIKKQWNETDSCKTINRKINLEKNLLEEILKVFPYK